MGLDGDYKLVILSGANGHKTDKETFKTIAFQIDIAIHQKKEDFLVATFILTNGINRRHKKPNVKLLYVQISSSYPLRIINGYTIIHQVKYSIMKPLYMTPPKQQLNKIRTRRPSVSLNKKMEANVTRL